MSQHAYGQHGFGMYLDTDEMEEFSRAYAKAEGISEDMFNWYDFSDALELTDDEVFDGRQIRHLEELLSEEDNDDFCEGVFFYADRQGSVISAPGQSYQSVREMADEFRQKYAAYLPTDFDFEAHMVEFLGAVVC